MTILDMQGMSQTRCGGGGGSHLSVALCDSFASIQLCL